jgi:DNA-binding SARP family transcriptional activator/predicted ATPase
MAALQHSRNCGDSVDICGDLEYTVWQGGSTVSRLALLVFGPPQIERDGVSIKMDRRKAVALLAYLAVTGERQRRDSLVNLLWPESDGPRGRAALRRTLYALRQELDGAWLDVDREEIGLNPDAEIWVDAVEFQGHLAACQGHGHPVSQVCPACVEPLSQAVALVRGEFLSGFSLKDSFNFDDWQRLQTEALGRGLDDALRRLVQWHSSQREFEAATAYARRRLALDPLDEGAHRQVMRLCAWSGRRSAALRQYEECMAVLDDQLGVPPQDETDELYQAIQAGRIAPPPDERTDQEIDGRADGTTDSTARPPDFLTRERPVERPLFVARERELGQLQGHLKAVLSGQGKVVFVTGDAGSGKTALIQAFAEGAQAAHPGLVMAGGHGNAHTGVGDPYLPFREILGLLTGDVEAQWAAGAMTQEQARRLWDTLPHAARALVEEGPDLVDTFVPGRAILNRVMACAPEDADWLARLAELVERLPATGPGVAGPQRHLFEQYTRVLQTVAQRGPVLLVVDDLQWADLGSINLLFHLGRQLGGSRILVVGAYRPEEVALGRDGGRHPLEPVVNEFQRDFGDIAVDVDRAGRRAFLEALLDSEANRLGPAFREMLYRQTGGHPLFTIELLRGMQDRGDLVRDAEGVWVEGAALDWQTLPARVEAVVAERIGRLPRVLRSALRVASVEGETFTAEVVARVGGTEQRKLQGWLSGELDRRHRLVQAQSIQRIEGQLLSRYRFRHILFQRYLYGSLDEVERVYLHEEVGRALEGLYGSSEEAGANALELARHFEEARIVDKGIQYLQRAGERAVQLSAYQEAIVHLTRGLDLLLSLPEPASGGGRLERARKELSLQIALGMAWKGMIPDPEGEKPLTRARVLCQQLGETTQLCRVLGELSIFPYVRAEYEAARGLGEEALDLAQQARDPLLMAIAHWHLGYVLFGLGHYAESRAHLEHVISFYKPQSHHHAFVVVRGTDAGVSALAYDACCLWCLGYPDQAAKQSQQAVAVAKELGHAFSLADVLCFAGCVFNSMRRDAQGLRVHAEELTRLSGDMGFSSFVGTGAAYWGEALSMLGQVDEGMRKIHEGMASRRSVGAHCYASGMLGALAEAHALEGQIGTGLDTLAEALAMVEETNERYCEAELHRLRGEMHLAQGNGADAGASFQEAVEAARRQNARSWELRATTSLARLWQKQGKRGEARQALAEIYDWFSEGFDTPDLKEAKALLEALA